MNVCLFIINDLLISFNLWDASMVTHDGYSLRGSSVIFVTFCVDYFIITNF